MKRLSSKRLAKEKTHLSREHYKIISMIILLVIFVFAAVTLILYVPTVTTTTDDDTTTESNDQETKQKDDKGVNDTYSGKSEELQFDSSSSSCDSDTYDEIIKKTTKINISFEYKEMENGNKIIDMTDGYDPENPIYVNEVVAGYVVSVKNIPSDVTIHITNDYNDTVYDVNSSNITDGVYTFNDTYAIQGVVKFTYEVTSVTCNQLVRKFTVSMPMINTLALTGVCKDSDSSDCELLTYAEIDDDEYRELEEVTTTESNSDTDNSTDTSTKTKQKLINIEFNFINVVIISVIVIAVILIGLFIFIRLMDIRRRIKYEKKK